MLLGTIFNGKMVKIRHKKTHWHLSEKSQQAHQHRLIALPIMASSPIQTKCWAGTQLGGLNCRFQFQSLKANQYWVLHFKLELDYFKEPDLEPSSKVLFFYVWNRNWN